MATRPRRQAGGYGYNMMQPSVSQYESFFRPIPLEFMQAQFDRRQGKYDAAFAGALAARDELSNVQVGMQDLADKNNIVNQAVSNIDNLVNSKYGGDWGRASKEIASAVSNVRSNPFWNAQAEAQKQRALAQELKIKYGPNSIIFNDPTNLSVLDEEGNVRDFSQFQPDIVEKGDWAATVQSIARGISPDTKPIGMSQAAFDLLKSGSITELSKEKLDTIAKDPYVQNVLRQTHPEFDRAFNELPQDRRDSLFFGAETPEQAAENVIKGVLNPMQFKQVQERHMENPQIDNARAARAAQQESRGLYIPNNAPDMLITPEDRSSPVKNLIQVNKKINRASGARKAELEQERANMEAILDFQLGTVENIPEYQVDFEEQFSNLQQIYGDDAIVKNKDYPSDISSPEELREKALEHIKNGTEPPRYLARKEETGLLGNISSGYGANTSGDNTAVPNPVWNAYNKYSEGLQAINDEALDVTLSANTVTGSQGDQKTQTLVNTYNTGMLDHWKGATSEFINPLNGIQVDAYLEKEHGKRKNDKNRRDPDKDKIVVLDTPINGKLAFQLTYYNEAGDQLGNIPVAPGNQDLARANLVEVSKDIMRNGLAKNNQTYVEYGKGVLINSTIRPMVQSAMISGDTSAGTLPTENLVGTKVHYEQIGDARTNNFRLYIVGEDGQRDYFRTPDGTTEVYRDDGEISQAIADYQVMLLNQEEE